jgi:Holliday junction resolvasome RuvABC endonuclease subunit
MNYHFTVVGIDQSLSSTGIVSVMSNGGKITPLTRWAIQPEARGFIRVEAIVNNILAHVKDTKPDYVVMEDVTRMAASASLSALVELAGIIRWELYKINVNVVVQNQSSMKSFSFGDGSTKKDSGYMLKVLDKTGQRFDTDDEADAFLHARRLAIIVNVLHGITKIDELPEYQRHSIFQPAKKISKLTDSKFAKLSLEDKLRWLHLAYSHLPLLSPVRETQATPA